MNVETFRRLQQGDYQDAEPWWFRALDPINTQFETVTNALRGGLSFRDNHNAEIREIELSDDTPVEIRVQSAKSPIGVFFLYSAFFEYYKLTWRPIESSEGTTVEVKVKWDSSPPSGDPVLVRLLIVGT